MFKIDLKAALRNLRRYKIYSLINISGLAIGLACAILIFVWARDELSYDRFHENIDDLYMVAFTTEDRTFHGDAHPSPLAEFLEDEYPEIIHATHISPIGLKLSHENNSLRSSGKFVHPAFFEMFSFPIISGDSEDPLSNPMSIVLTEKLAAILFGKEDPIGKSVNLEDRHDFIVSAVIQNPPSNSDIQFDYLLSAEVSPNMSYNWEMKCAPTFVQLQKGTSHEEVSARIVDVYNDHNPGCYKNNLYLQPFKDRHLHALGGGGRITYVYVFSAMALVILLIACINFMNLSTARSEKRFREIGIKKVVGSSRLTLVRQFLGESILLALVALIFALIIAELLLPSINNLLGRQLTLNLTGVTIPILLGITILTGIISGSYPAFYLSSLKPVNVLKNQLQFKGPGKSRLSPRKLLVVLQFSLSIFFIVCAAVIHNQLEYIKSKDLGFNKEHIVMLNLQGEMPAYTSTLKTELLKNPNIESVTISANELFRWSSSSGIDWEGKQTDKVFDVGYNWVDYDYLKTFKLKLKEGRFFSEEFSTDRSEAIVVNEAAIKAMGLENPIGKKVIRMPGSTYEDTRTIIGVVRDFHTESLHGDIRPFMLMLTGTSSYMCIRVKPDNIPATLGFIQGKVREFVPSDPFEYRFLDDDFDALYRTEQVTGKLTIYVTILAIFVSCLGLTGLAMFTAERRTREIGIRKVLGSSVSAIVLLLSREFARWVLLANLIAWPLAYLVMKRWLENFAYSINLSWQVFLFSGLVALAIALITVIFQSARAALANPVDSLRQE
jgi:putative ABC transport system permease protein